jgi:hypothetical protein
MSATDTTVIIADVINDGTYATVLSVKILHTFAKNSPGFSGNASGSDMTWSVGFDAFRNIMAKGARYITNSKKAKISST